MGEAQHVDAVVIGAGLAGIYQLHRLQKTGFTSRVFEAGGDVGGTWYWNRYPGARCDVESLSYSYSFSSELEQEWVWTEKYPTQPEILKYINHVVDRFDLRSGITFNTRVVSASYRSEEKRWIVETDAGETISAQFVVTAVGCLSSSKGIEVPGIERFHGRIYHTGRWPHEPVELKGKRVAIISTGSSGIQSIPVIAEQAAEVTVFQRTAAYSMPAGNRPLTGDEIAEMKASYPAWRARQRYSSFGVPVEEPKHSALQVSDGERTAKYQACWEEGSLIRIMFAYTDMLSNIDANETAADFIREKIRATVKDPKVAEALTPRSYPVGTKRPCLDSGYYQTFNKEHVDLVNLRDTPIIEIVPEGIRTSEKVLTFDVIVFATGFDAITGALAAIDIRGRGEQALKGKWANGPRSYLGLVSAGFPNLFTITGPTSPSVMTNMVVAIEQHVDWITDCISYMRNGSWAEIDATIEAEDAWGVHAAEVAEGTLYPRAESWYMGSNVPGKPRTFLAYLGGMGRYRDQCDDVAKSGYRGFILH